MPVDAGARVPIPPSQRNPDGRRGAADRQLQQPHGTSDPHDPPRHQAAHRQRHSVGADAYDMERVLEAMSVRRSAPEDQSTNSTASHSAKPLKCRPGDDHRRRSPSPCDDQNLRA